MNDADEVFSKSELQTIIEKQIKMAATNPDNKDLSRIAIEGARIWADHEKSQVELIKSKNELEAIKYKSNLEHDDRKKDRKQEWFRIGIIAAGSVLIAWIGNDYKADTASRFFGLLNRKSK